MLMHTYMHFGLMLEKVTAEGDSHFGIKRTSLNFAATEM